MDQERKMQKLVTAAGECWHETKAKGFCKCGAPCNIGLNPSPTDLNELFRLAEKLNIDTRVAACKAFHEDKRFGGRYSAQAYASVSLQRYDACSEDPAEALLNALFKAVDTPKCCGCGAPKGGPHARRDCPDMKWRQTDVRT